VKLFQDRVSDPSRLLTRLKNVFVRPGRELRRIRFGPNRGLLMYLDLRHDLQRQMGLYEQEISRYLRRYARGIKTAIDVGAGDGFYTLHFLSDASVRTVFAFEPSGEALARLTLNLEANGFKQDGRLVLSSQSVGSHCNGVTTTLEGLSELIKTPCLIKIDVEGAEADVLAGAGRILGFHHMRWLIETHSRVLEEACHHCLSRWGYDTVVVPNAWWRAMLPELRPIAHNRWLFAWRPE
jgi:Methyltransferase FkbM domain